MRRATKSLNRDPRDGSGAQTGLFVPELGKLFAATIRQPTGQGGEILVYETK